MKRLFVFLFLFSFSVCSFSAGIRWLDRYPFHKPNNVNVTGGIPNYSRTINDGSKALIVAEASANVDDVLLTFTAFRGVTLAGLADLALTLVKRLGPSVIITTLGPLVWNELKGIWEKPTSSDVLGTGNLFNSTSCLHTGLGVVYYSSDGSACVRRCHSTWCPSDNHLPWVVKNHNTVTSENVGCSASCLGTGSSVWAMPSNYSHDPGYITASDNDILSALNTYLSNLSNLTDMINNLILNGDGQKIYDLSQPDHLTGPANLSDINTKVIVDNSGQTNITTLNNYYFSYAPTSITINKTETVTTTNPDNSTHTVTTTTTADTTTPADTTGSTNQTDFCADHPDVIACGIGGSLSDINLPSQNKDMSISSELSSSGACPADISFTVRGHVFVVSWSPICSFASSIRPMVILMAWLSAGLFVFYVLSRV